MNQEPWVYITGCDTGFGNIAVGMFQARGVSVFAGCYLDESLERVKSSKCFPLKLNVANEASVLDAADKIKAHLQSVGGQLIGVINNAGILVQPCPAEWQSLKDFRDMFEVNVLGTVAVTNSVLPLIRASKGRIVCVSSIAGRIGIRTQAAYCASKFAVQGYADVLRQDMYPWGVTVSIVEPGIFSTTGLYGRFQTGLDHVWDRLDPAIKADYGEEYKTFVRKILGAALHELGTTDATRVPKAYIHAVLDPKPLYRYRVGWDSKYLVTFLQHVHESTQDAVLTFNDGRIPTVVPAKAPKDGSKVAWSRYDKNWPRFFLTVAVLAYVWHKLRNSSR